MNYRMIGYLLGIILMIEAALLLLPMLVALIYGESALPFLLTIDGWGGVWAPFPAPSWSSDPLTADDSSGISEAGA